MNKELNDIMQFDHVIRVHADGSVTDVHGQWAPELYDESIESDKWEFFSTGYSGQDSYHGPIMHDSEFIGGGLERDILANPGVYVAVVSAYNNVCDRCHEGVTVIGGEDSPERMVHILGTDDDYEHEATDDETYLEGWAVLRLLDEYDADHEHQFGPMIVSRMTGNPYRPCFVSGCRTVSLD